MFCQDGLYILQNNDMKFPYVPWIAFEDERRRWMEHGTVYNLASGNTWVALKRTRFARHRNAQTQLYGYDYARYGTTFDDSLKISRLFEVLETYAQAYFISIIQSSLIVANYSVRTDNVFVSYGNFPIWQTDLFLKRQRPTCSHEHILYFDVLRCGINV